ncbi:hypothetical protein CRUP_012829, partial [Coryphaenoides rupestris]
MTSTPETLLEELEAKTKELVARKTTPLLDFLKNKQRIKEEKKEERRRRELERKRLREEERRKWRDDERRRRKDAEKMKKSEKPIEKDPVKEEPKIKKRPIIDNKEDRVRKVDEEGRKEFREREPVRERDRERDRERRQKEKERIRRQDEDRRRRRERHDGENGCRKREDDGKRDWEKKRGGAASESAPGETRIDLPFSCINLEPGAVTVVVVVVAAAAAAVVVGESPNLQSESQTMSLREPMTREKIESVLRQHACEVLGGGGAGWQGSERNMLARPRRSVQVACPTARPRCGDVMSVTLISFVGQRRN